MTTRGGPATPAVDRTAASILDLTKHCLSQFDEALASQVQHESSKEWLETRLADFNLWISGVGAIAKSGLSLDSRLHLRPDDRAMVKTVLLMLFDSLEHCMSLSQVGKNFQDGVQNVDSAVRNLALIGVAIRRTGKASRSRRADRTFNPDEHHELRKHLECVLLLRPTEAGRHSDELDPSKLSDLQRRLIDANLRRRHQFLLAQRRSRNPEAAQKQHPVLESTSSPDGTPGTRKDARPDDSRNPDGNTKGKDPLVVPTISGFSRASTAEGTLEYAPAKPYIPGATKTQITSIASDAEFPHPPVIPEDREIFQCPCCCQSLQLETFKDPKLWKRHIVEDLRPYTCIAESCPTPHLLFCTRSEWEMHVKKSHVPRWECPFCDENDARQPNMEAMVVHLQTDHKDELASKSLSMLLSWSAVQTMGIRTCPFCSSRGPEDAPDLVDHVLQEAYEFALRALPWPKPIDHGLNGPPGVFKLADTEDDENLFSRWIMEPVPGEKKAVDLEFCHYDTADHSEPINLGEYTDYFDEGGYFDDKDEDKSSAAASGFSDADSRDTAGRTTLTSASSDLTPILARSITQDDTEQWPRRPATRREFEIVIFCALPIEVDAVSALFDRYWDDDGLPYGKVPGDPNVYLTGVIGRHNVVLVDLSGMGRASAAFAAAECRASFPIIKLALLVGICGAVPFRPGISGETVEIVLGDVVISDCVVRYSLRRQYPSHFAREDTFWGTRGRTSTEIRALLAKLNGLHGREMLQRKMAMHLDMLRGEPRLEAAYPGATQDRLFEATYQHVTLGMSCAECGCDGKLVPRARLERGDGQPAVHFGLVTSSDTVIRSGEHREDIAQKEGVIGFDLEGADVWDTLPCVFIKGACDYADGHKNKVWQRYAAATAAACMKAFLAYWVPSTPSS